MTADAVDVTVAGIALAYGAAPVLHGVDLELPAGTVTALLGPSGCGKTTALRVIAGLERPDTGTVTVGGRQVTGPGVLVPPERRRVGLVFQHGALFPHLDVARNVGFGLPPSERRGGPRVATALALVGLGEFAARTIDSLSGGQAQRVALARALAPEPSVLLLDEPFANLDAVLRRRVRDEVAAIIRTAGVTALLVTHDREEAFAVADRVAVMREGRIVQVGAPRSIYDDPADEWVAAVVGDLSGWPGDPTLRPERLEFADTAAPGSVRGVVTARTFTGPDVVVTVRLERGADVVVRRRAVDATGTEPEVGVVVGVRPVADSAP